MAQFSFSFSTIYVYIAIAIVLIIYFIFRDQRENLRIQGSLDLRGDPDTAPSYSDHMGMMGMFPFNFGTSFPTERRRMIME
jgi:hypothetical protein